MMGKWTEKIYKASPLWLQTLGINTFGYFWARRRLGPVFEQTWREYVERETWAPERMREYVENQLRTQVQRAYRDVHYYRETFRKHGVSESVIENFTSADLPSLPLLDKLSVRRNPTCLLTEQSAKHPPK